PPAPEPRDRVLLVYGIVSLAYSVALLAAGLSIMARVAGRSLGLAGWAAVGVLALLSVRGVFNGILQGEVRQMLRSRRGRTAAWLAGLAAVPLALSVIPIPDRAGGPMQLRPANRVELRAPVAGFIQEVHGDEGSAVGAGAVLAVLEVPDLASRTEQK